MTLHIPLKFWRQLQCYVACSQPNEVTGLGAIEFLSPEDARVTQIFLPEQLAGPASCHVKRTAFAQIISDYVRNDPTQVGNLCFRWHSHGNLESFWSKTDLNDINKWTGDCLFSLVTNAKFDTKIRFDLLRPYRIVDENVKLQIVYDSLAPELFEKYSSEVRAKVETETFIGEEGKL